METTDHAEHSFLVHDNTDDEIDAVAGLTLGG